MGTPSRSSSSTGGDARGHRLALSVDLDEWYHSRRWVDGRQAREVPDLTAVFRQVYGADRPAGEIVAPTLDLLDLFDEHGVSATFFVLGEVAEWYPDLVREIGRRGHELACHGMRHVDMTVLGPDRFRRELVSAVETIERIAGTRAVGYRAPNLVYASWATRILEDEGFLYDSSVCVSRPLSGKYQGYGKAPVHPYLPAYDDIARPGDARLVELPLPGVPILRLPGGSSIATRLLGYSATRLALAVAIRRGNTAYYLHPWELARPPDGGDRSLKNVLFRWRTGSWMRHRLRRLLERYRGRIVTCRESAESLVRPGVSQPAAAGADVNGDR